jgi:hypothetical protein
VITQNISSDMKLVASNPFFYRKVIQTSKNS